VEVLSWDLKRAGYRVGLSDVKAQSFVFLRPCRFDPELGGESWVSHIERYLSTP
jgi:hypothetical protein